MSTRVVSLSHTSQPSLSRARTRTLPRARYFAMSRTGGASSSSSSVRVRGDRVRTPTHPTEGDYMSVKAEECLFGLLFAFMAFKLWMSVRGLLRYWRFVRTPNAPDVQAEDGLAFEQGDDESEDEKKLD